MIERDSFNHQPIRSAVREIQPFVHERCDHQNCRAFGCAELSLHASLSPIHSLANQCDTRVIKSLGVDRIRLLDGSFAAGKNNRFSRWRILQNREQAGVFGELHTQFAHRESRRFFGDHLCLRWNNFGQMAIGPRRDE